MSTDLDPTHPFHPFSGHNDLGDTVRIGLIVVSFALIMVIARAIIEGHRRRDMDRYQVARFVFLQILVGSLSLGSASKFGASLNGYVVANVVGVAGQWYGVAGIRREQRSGTGQDGQPERKAGSS